MRIGYVASSVRARPMIAGLLAGEERSRLMRCGSLAEVVNALGSTAYGPQLDSEARRPALERRLRQTLLDELRVLAAWMPPGGADLIRAAAGYFEMQNVIDRAAELTAGARQRRRFELGPLAAVPPGRLAGAATADELERLLADSPWGDPGVTGGAGLERYLERSWLRRLSRALSRLRHADNLRAAVDRWLGAGSVLRLARLRFVRGLSTREAGEVEPPWPRAVDRRAWERLAATERMEELSAASPRRHRWVLAGVDSPDMLFRAESRLWRAAAADARNLSARTEPPGPSVVAGYAVRKAEEVRAVVGIVEGMARGMTGESIAEALGA